ncbi:cysteine-rich venom protein [Elysia marginata]|uniref:Cysteine-rich venom protein n=1 Tax=Elysia marginata TaxID=1093978 RepID=A0AAV4HAR4_9GAST|nr:cysteine-rich venom protein [Elysia marginata]
MDLETTSKKWAENCHYAHSHLEGIGENLAYSTYPHSEETLVSNAATAWFEEKKQYIMGSQKSCGSSDTCHYLQMVWDDTNKVGCYSTRCAELTRTGTEKKTENAWYFVCSYTPKGNWIGQRPYETSCDSPCRDGQTEEDGLCVGEAIIPCVDKHAQCVDWAGRGECSKNPDYMESKCRKSCKVCESGDESATEDSTGEGSETEDSTEDSSETQDSTEDSSETQDRTGDSSETQGGTGDSSETGKSKEPAECKDENAGCLGWAAVNQCTISPDYMLAFCRWSCKVCDQGRTAGECDNKDASCEDWASHDHCEKNPGYMLTNCRKACGACSEEALNALREGFSVR